MNSLSTPELIDMKARKGHKKPPKVAYPLTQRQPLVGLDSKKKKKFRAARAKKNRRRTCGGEW